MKTVIARRLQRTAQEDASADHLLMKFRSANVDVVLDDELDWERREGEQYADAYERNLEGVDRLVLIEHLADDEKNWAIARGQHDWAVIAMKRKIEVHIFRLGQSHRVKYIKKRTGDVAWAGDYGKVVV